ncbi:MAG: class II fructose-bisphosphate aldolase [Anaerolineales bacterium]
MAAAELQTVLDKLEGSVLLEHGKVIIKDQAKLRKNIHHLAEISALEKGAQQGWARYLARLIALELDIVPASIHDLYMARGRGDVPPTFTVPAMNLRALSYDAAKAVFRAANALKAGAFIFEIARSEIGYSDQRPAEYATNIFVAAIEEGFRGPVFIQGDHFQVSAKKYAADAEAEIQAIRNLTQEAISAGFYNIDIDTSTLVDISKPTIPEQQTLNTGLSAMFTEYIRTIEPKGITISVGGEIGEVGGKNSTVEELRGYMDGYNSELKKKGDYIGISKISVQTGTTHGGVVLPDGSIAQVSVDFDTLQKLSQVARQEYGLGGAVQHGASTLPEDAFGKFVEHEACEVHLATNFQNMLFDRLPEDLKKEMYAFLDEKYANERKPGMTDEQFYYKTRKNAIGPFKTQTWNLPKETKELIGKAWEDQFSKLFHLLCIKDTQNVVQNVIKPIKVQPDVKDYLGEAIGDKDIKDLAD